MRIEESVRYPGIPLCVLLSSGWLSAKTIVNYTLVVKLVIASAVDEEGQEIYPRKWNHVFIQLLVVCKKKQHRPTVTEVDLADILSRTNERKYLALFALLAATGCESARRLD